MKRFLLLNGSCSVDRRRKQETSKISSKNQSPLQQQHQQNRQKNSSTSALPETTTSSSCSNSNSVGDVTLKPTNMRIKRESPCLGLRFMPIKLGKSRPIKIA